MEVAPNANQGDSAGGTGDQLTLDPTAHERGQWGDPGTGARMTSDRAPQMLGALGALIDGTHLSHPHELPRVIDEAFSA